MNHPLSIRLLIRRRTTPKTLLYKISNLSTTSYQHQQSSYQSRRHEEESRNVRVSVWWDFENCSVPVNTNVFKVTQSITAAVRASGIKGPIHITAFGDVMQLSRSNQEALSATGINLTHIPHGGKNSADRSLLIDLMYWVSQNPPPAHLFLISGDRDFASILHKLRMSNYNILLASPDSAPGVLCSAASIMWQWNALVRGENLTGKHFNQPPDGPYGSWYGQYRVPLEDPFSVADQPQPVCSQSNSESNELVETNSETKPRPVPKAVLKVIRDILNSYPKGLSITELRAELGKSNVTIERDMYGYKKFSRFLSSMTNILKLQSIGDGQFLVRGIAPKVSEPAEATPVVASASVPNNRDRDSTLSSSNKNDASVSCVGQKVVPLHETPLSSNKINPQVSCVGQKVVPLQEPPLSSSEKDVPISIGSQKAVPLREPLKRVKKVPTELQEPPSKVGESEEVSHPSPLFGKISNSQVTPCQPLTVLDTKPMPEVGVFKRMWRKLFGGKDVSEDKICNELQMCSSGDSTEKITGNKEHVDSNGRFADPVSPSLSSFSVKTNEVIDDKSVKSSGFFNHVKRWFTSEDDPQDSSKLPTEETSLNTLSEMKEPFSEGFSECFWNVMLAFLETSDGSNIILQSRTRKEMVQNLQQRGPTVLRSLSERRLLDMVDVLVFEKRWIEESPSQTHPYTLSLPGKNNSNNSAAAKDLRSIFFSRESKEGVSQAEAGNEMARRQNHLPHSGNSVANNKNVQKKPSASDISRSQILGDCQKLVNEVVRTHPDGFNMGSFGKLFFDRYDYSLDVRKLGYQKLATLLNIMPGVKIESTFILPSVRVSNNSSGSDTDIADPPVGDGIDGWKVVPRKKTKDDDADSVWDELGPVANNTVNKSDDITRKVKKGTAAQIHHHDFESLSDTESDSEEESGNSHMAGGQGTPKTNDEDSSLLRILDSWYGNNSKEENPRNPTNYDKKIVSESGSDGSSDTCSRNVSNDGKQSSSTLAHSGRRQVTGKSYSFVADNSGDGDTKSKLIDDILGSLKKSGDGLPESRMHG